MIKKYIKEIRAIAWDGKEETLEFLLGIYNAELRAWMVNTTNPLDKGSLRISLNKYQGDYWLAKGDYIILGEDRVYVQRKKEFETTYRLKETN